MHVAVVVLVILIVLGGLGVLGVLGWKLWQQVRSLGRTVARAGDRIAEASENMPEVRQVGRVE